MARPRAFDTQSVLDAATELFWAHGYEGVGLSELLAAMRIQRGSLYKAWGSKRALFLACLDYYDSEHVEPGLAFLRGEGGGAGLSGAGRIDMVFESHDVRGCLLCNTAAGIAGTDDEIAARVNQRLDDIRLAFAAALADHSKASDVAAEADRLTQQYVGLRVRQRTDRSSFGEDLGASAGQGNET